MALDNYKVARPYANALFEYAKEKQILDAWRQYLHVLKQVMSDASAQSFVNALEVTKDQKLSFLMSFVESESLKESASNFLQLLLENKRILALPEAVLLFDELFDEHQQRLQAKAVSYKKLNDLQLEKLKQALSKRFDRKVEISNEIDESLLGGVVIYAGNVVIDMSVAAQLKQMVDKLAA